MLAIPPLPQDDDQAAALSRGQTHLHVEGGAGIEPRPELARQGGVTQGGWPYERAITTEKGETVSRRRRGCLAGVREGDPPCELLVVGVRGQDGFRLRVELRHHVQVVSRLGRTQTPFVVGEDAQSPRPAGTVGEGQQGELHRVLRVHEDREVLEDPVGGMGETRDAGPVPRYEPSAVWGAACRPWRR
jgi:hypothetical protein